MKFVQRSAGNAQRWQTLRLGVASLTIVLALPFASAAQASDPLLSGYAGPGGGEQVVLGSTTVKSTKSASSSGASQDPATAPLKAEATPAATSSTGAGNAGSATSTLTRKPQRKKSSSSTSKDMGNGHDTTTTTATSGSSTTTATLPGAPEVVAYPTRAGEVGGLPVSAAGMLLIVLGVAAATLLGLGLRRISGSDDPSDPQVSA